MKKQLTRILLTLAIAASLAQAHFIFVVPEPDGAAAKVFISEELTPDAMVSADMVAAAKLSVRDANGADTPLTLTKGANAYIAALPGGGPRVVHGLLDLGFTQRGESTPHLLLYYPKTILGDAFGAHAKLDGDVPVELVPLGLPGAVKLQLIARGKPLADAEVTVILPDGSQEEVTTDSQGQTETLTQKGRYGAWARFWEKSPGERDGKKYHELRHYAMLVFDAPSAPQADASGEAQVIARMPEAAASFGGVVSDGWLYIYGGHISPTHSYSTAAVSGKFHRMQLSSPGKWEELPGGPAVQGMNLAAHQGKIYRVGGMEPRNAPGEPSDNHSLTSVARFDPASGKWGELPPLPQGLSSHDVVVVGDTLVVVGGWEMQGKEEGEVWNENVLTLDLTAKKLEWKSAPQPFKRRALIAASFEGKVFVIGGINDANEVLGEVEIYDPATRAWSEGPALSGGSAHAFAPAAAVHAGCLYVSLGDGSLYRLSRSGNEWEPAGKASPRVAHRVLSSGEKLLIVGGAKRGANLDVIEAVTVAEAAR
jgi:hypothetical protein